MTREERIKRERIRQRRKKRRIRRLLQLAVWTGIIVIALATGTTAIKFLAAQFDDSFETDQMSAEDMEKTDTYKEIFENRALYPKTMLEALEKIRKSRILSRTIRIRSRLYRAESVMRKKRRSIRYFYSGM